MTFAQGETTQTITVNVIDDNLVEVNETLTATISDPSGTVVTPTIGNATASTDILDNDGQTSIAIAADATSVNESAGTITFTVTRTGDAEGSQSVDYALSGVEAEDISSPFTGTVTFAQGETTQTITVNVIDDNLVEVTETLTATISDPSGTVVPPTLGNATASTDILDNDGQTSIAIAADATRSTSPPAPSPSRSPAPAMPRAASRSTTRSPASRPRTFPVRFTGTVTFAQGETTQTIT